MTTTPPEDSAEPRTEGGSASGGDTPPGTGLQPTPPPSVPPPPAAPDAAPDMAPRRLYRSRTESWFGGVAGGLAEYFDTDPTLVRIAFVVLTVLTSGLGIVAYVIGWIVIPEAPQGVAVEGGASVTAPSRHRGNGILGGIIWGGILIAVGVLFLLRQLDVDVDWVSWRVFASGALILTGLAMAFEARRGTSGGLLSLAIVLTAILGLASVADFDADVDGAFGESTIRVTDPARLDETYSYAFGSLTLDLRDLEVADGQTVRVNVSVAFGEAVIRLPDDVAVRTSVSSAFGSVDGPNVDTGGIVTSRDYEPPGWADASRRLDLHLTTVFGSGSIR